MLYLLLKMVVSIVFNFLNLLLGGRLPPFGSAAVIVEEQGRYLVVEHPRKRITFPGGFMNWRETPQQAARREGKEETGFELEIGELIKFYTGTSGHWLQMSTLSFVYSGHVVGGRLRKSAEGRPLWLDEGELRKRLGKGGQHLLDDYLAYRANRQHTPVS